MNKKKSFILHIDSLDILNELTDEQAGKLFKAIHLFHNGSSIELDTITKLVFTPFKNQFLRDEDAYSEICEGKSVRGKIGNLKRWHPDLFSQLDDNQSNIDKLWIIAKGRSSDVSNPNVSLTIPKSLDSKNDSKSKNENTSLKKKQKVFFGDEHKNYLAWFNKVTGKGIKSFSQTDINNLEQLKELKYTGKDHNDAVKMLMANEWAKDNGAVSPSHFLRKDNFERYLQQSQVGGKEVCPYSDEQLRLANKYLESGGTPEWFDKKWIQKLPSYGTKHS